MEGGLGITDMKKWNRAACMGLVLKVFNDRDSLWSQWVWAHHLRGNYFWTTKIPKDCSWAWRQTLKGREDAIKHTRYSITDGKATLLWHDPWCSEGPLLENFAAKEAWLHRFALDSKVEVLITNGYWNDEVRQLQNQQLRDTILATKINSRLEIDRIIWTPSKSGMFSVRSAYKTLSGEQPRVRWYGFVWNKLVLPRHSFSAWQLLSGCLPTQDNLVKRRVLNYSSCILCNGSRENSKHLYFECPYSKEIWEHVRDLLEIRVDNRNVNRLWMSIIKLCKGKSVTASIYSTVICATVNYIWVERNMRRFQNKSQNAYNLKHRLCKEIRRYLQMQIKDIPDSPPLKALISRLGIVCDLKAASYIPCTWSKPMQGIVKLNSDGAVRDSGNGFGGLLRNWEGEVLCAYSGNDICNSVFHQELNAVHQGLKLALFLNVRSLEVASDSLSVTRAINKLEKPPWDCEDQLKRIWDLASDFAQIRFYHGVLFFFSKLEMGFSEKHQVDGGLELEGKKWVIVGIPILAPLKQIRAKKMGKDIENEKEEEEEERSTTPTAVDSRIPERSPCPPAPRKCRPSLRCNFNGVRDFFSPPDLESFFIPHVET
ncbi:Cyclin-dependent protein kinase inhibitor smr6 [Thalictrum thalictroides]|uniref:Cyclin-dependent protein kinase inhibitor smr6 n=1 Tax=Thalictrum thalictroides TaxID=46969 RepID=A0A7J6X5M1_THATH|nr:Cyclin-dependent protein kinase inhibitor smr6 [Thalictrum thalictroides]